MRVWLESRADEAVVYVEGKLLFDRDDIERLLGSRWEQIGLLPGQAPSNYEPIFDKGVRRERWTFKKGGHQ